MKKNCERCGNEFASDHRVTRFCSLECGSYGRAKPILSDQKVIARFWTRVSKTSNCWEWTGAKGDYGYGSIRWRGKRVGVHRFAWFVAHGEKPHAELNVLHSCDNRLCVNPAHLRLGTKADNIQDMYERGRSRFNRPPRARMTVEKVAEIRKLRASGMAVKKIAQRYGMSLAAIYRIVNNQAWNQQNGAGAHVEEKPNNG